MKRVTFIFIVLLLAVALAYADGSTAAEAEHWEKSASWTNWQRDSRLRQGLGEVYNQALKECVWAIMKGSLPIFR